MAQIVIIGTRSLLLTIIISAVFIFSFTVKLKAQCHDTANGEKKIYLTFDDGPSKPITDKILDILKENDVKATFFVVGNQIDGLEAVIRRIHNEGHNIGLHSYSHSYKKIYSSRNAFIKEMQHCQSKVNEVVGVKPYILKFPGGSQKRLSKNFLNLLHGYHFKIYDWNMETVDGLKAKASPDRIFIEATKGSEELSTIILLLHCDYMHKNTCTALPRIIQYYKDRGYEFKIITEDTPELFLKY